MTRDDVVELDRIPTIGALYRRAVLGALPLPGVRRTAETLPATTLALSGVRVDRALLTEYDRVCGFRLGDPLPPTFTHVLAFPLAMSLMSGPDFPFPMLGLVHVANRIEVHRPVDADEPLRLAVRCADLRPHRRGRQFDVVATASVGTKCVWRGVSTYLRRESDTDARDRRDRAGDPRTRPDRDPAAGSPDRPAAPPAGGPAARSTSDPAALWRVDGRVGTGYAEVSGDHNPIHTSVLGAKLFGFRRPIAHGMWSKARCLAALHARLPDAYAVDVTFKLPIGLPSTVAFTTDPPWSFALHGVGSGKPHLSGTVAPLDQPIRDGPADHAR